MYHWKTEQSAAIKRNVCTARSRLWVCVHSLFVLPETVRRSQLRAVTAIACSDNRKRVFVWRSIVLTQYLCLQDPASPLSSLVPNTCTHARTHTHTHTNVSLFTIDWNTWASSAPLLPRLEPTSTPLISHSLAQAITVSVPCSHHPIFSFFHSTPSLVH